MNGMVRVMSAVAEAMFLVPLSFAAGWDASLADFPRQAGETDDTARLQRAVDATPHGVVSVPGGLYRLSSTLWVTNACSLRLHKTAVIRAVRPMEFLVVIDLTKGTRLPKDDFRSFDRNLFLTGGKLDGNGIASCLSVINPAHYTLRDTTFLNGNPYGLMTKDGYEVIAANLYFQCAKSGLAGNTAAYICGGDSHFTDCVVVDYTIGFRNARGSNRYTRCHVWGGPLPALEKGGEREMLKDSVNFWNEGGDAVYRDCYADTGKTGFRIDRMAQLLGCRYFNNRVFKLDDITVIEHRRSPLYVSACHFMSGGTPNIRLYAASPEAKGRAVWRDCTCSGEFADRDEVPGMLDFEADQDIAEADAWEYLPERPYVFASDAGAFAAKTDCKDSVFDVARRRMRRRFPDAGPGKTLVVRARATDAQTKKVELALIHVGGKVWGTVLPLTQEWKVLEIPLDKLSYFGHWKGVPPLQPGDRPDARNVKGIRFCFGKFLCKDTLDLPHGFEVESVRIVGR